MKQFFRPLWTRAHLCRAAHCRHATQLPTDHRHMPRTCKTVQDRDYMLRRCVRARCILRARDSSFTGHVLNKFRWLPTRPLAHCTSIMQHIVMGFGLSGVAAHCERWFEGCFFGGSLRNEILCFLRKVNARTRLAEWGAW